MAEESQLPGINPELIRRYAEGAEEWGIQQLITLFDHLRRGQERAEMLSRVYFDQMVVLEQRLKAQTGSSAIGAPSARQSPAPGNIPREPSDKELARGARRAADERDAPKAPPRRSIEDLL